MMIDANTNATPATNETYHLEIFGQFLNLNNFQGTLFAPTRGKVAVANDSYLIISDGLRMDRDSAAYSDVTDINTLIEFSEFSGKPTALSWISETLICVGYDTGTVACFDTLGNLVFERKFAGSAVQAVRMSDENSALDAGRAGCLWIMHARGRLISVPFESITTGCGDDCASFKFVENVVNVSDFVVPPFIYRRGVFDLDGSLDATYSLLVASDSDATLSLYNIGGKQQFQHLGKLGSYVKTQVTSAISKTFQNIFSFGSASPLKVKGALDKPPTTVALASLIDFEDSKRKVLRMRLDPFGSLVAASDNLGRVTLYDLRLNVVIRLWKGVRDARLAWSCSERESSTYLSLAIYAPQLGLLSFYGMRHGPCLRIVPIPSGAQCQIYTTVYPPKYPHQKHSHRLATCCLARGMDGSAHDSSDDEATAVPGSPIASEPHTMKIKVIVLDPYVHQPGDLDPCACTAGAGAGVRQEDEKPASHSTGSLSGNALDEDAFLTEKISPSLPVERYGITATSLPNGSSGPDTGLGSSPFPEDTLSLGDKYLPLPLPLSFPLFRPLSPPMSTTRGSEDIVKTFRTFLAGMSQGLDLGVGAGERQVKTEESPAFNKPDEDTLHYRVADSESYLLSLLSSLSSLDALVECSMMVENLELTGHPVLEQNGLSREVSNTFSFSIAFHRSIHQTVTSVMARQSSASTRSLDVLGAEIAWRGRLLDAYAALAERDRWAPPPSSSDEQLDAAAEHPVSHYSSLNTSRAEALSWLHSSMRQSQRERQSGLKAAADKEQTSHRPSISFTLFRALNRTTHLHSKKLSSVSAAAPDGQSAAPAVSVTYALRKLLDLGPDSEMATLEVDNSGIYSSIVRRGAVEQVGVAANIALPSSVRCEVFDFFSSPLLARDVFGLQNYSSALETIGLTCSSRMQLVLSCAAVHLQSVSKKALVIVLMSDVSSSPLQRWLRDSLLNLFDDYSALSSIRAKSGNMDIDNDTDDPASVALSLSLSLGDEVSAEPPSPMTSKTRWSISNLEDSLREMYESTAASRGTDPGPDLDPDQEQGQGLPSFDTFARYLLRRAWAAVRGSTHMVPMMALVAMVNETLLAVSDQIERRSYGTSNLKTTMWVWENLFRQLRVTMVLNNHMDTVGEATLAASIKDYSHFARSDDPRRGQASRSPSVYRVLALDSLSFADRAEDSVAHESQCKAVYLKKMQQIEQASKATSTSLSRKEKESDSVATMWGSSAESNWREMLPPIPSTRTGHGSGTGQNKRMREKERERGGARRRPLLLHFPLHNQPTILSAYRALELSQRWALNTHRVGLLRAACEHIVEVSNVTKAAVAEFIIKESLLRVTMLLVHRDQTQQQPTAIRDGIDVCAFCSAAIDLLHMVSAGSAELQQQQSNTPRVPPPAKLFALPADQTDPLHQLEVESAGPMSTWPPVEDSFLADLVVMFHRRSGCDLPTLHLHEAVFRVLQLCHMLRLDSDSSHPSLHQHNNGHHHGQQSRTSGSASRSHCNPNPNPTPNPSTWVSRLFQSRDLNALCLSLNHCGSQTDASRERFPDSAHHSERLNFLRICFTSTALVGDSGADDIADLNDPVGKATSAGEGCMLLSDTSSVSSSDIRLNTTTVCYALSDLWGVSVQVSRIIHLESLLDFDRANRTLEPLHLPLPLHPHSRHDLSGSRDMEIENLIPLIANCALVIRKLISSLRRRIGRAVCMMEGLSCYGPLLAITDSDAVTWCLHWADEKANTDMDMEWSNTQSDELPLERKITHRSLSDGNRDSDSSGTVRLSFNLGSTRNLVARIHSLLEAVSARGQRMTDSEVHCQALLALCDMLASLKA